MTTMPRFGSELPAWTERFKSENDITVGMAAQLRTEIARLGDKYLATTYNDLPTIHRASALGEFLADEIVERFLQQNIIMAFS